MACNERKKVREYHDNGEIFKSYYLENGEISGKYSEYYENGDLKISGFYKDNKANGVFKEYSKDGQLIEIGQYIDDTAIGWFEFYDHGKKKKKKQYITFNGSSYINQFKLFNKNGDVIKDSSNFITVDQINANQYLVKLEAPMFSDNYMEILLGHFNDGLNTSNESKVDTIRVMGKLEKIISLGNKQKAIICDLEQNKTK